MRGFTGFHAFVIAIWLAVGLAVGPVAALEVSSELVDLRPVNLPSLTITLRGDIEAGDTDRVGREIARFEGQGVESVLFLFDSAGGSLDESLRLGTFIAGLPMRTSAQVGGAASSDAICASACVYAFLGAQYRYLATGRIGVHRFYSGEAAMDGAEAMELAQTAVTAIAGYLRGRGVDPAFLDDIASSGPDAINWVSAARLAEVGVLTQGVAAETVEYRNIDGTLVLFIRQVAAVGTSTLFLSCGERGLVGVAALTQPAMAFDGTTEIVVGDMAFAANEVETVQDDGRVVRKAFLVPPEAASEMARQSAVGIRIVAPSGYVFFGFAGDVADPKIAETVATCQTQSLTPARMKRFDGYDVAGADFDGEGVRDISLAQCEQVCLALPLCRAVSYVTEKHWCWPKREGGRVMERDGIITSVKP